VGSSAGRAVTSALQAYADRGVFRAFRATPLGRGRTEFQFHWLLHRPMRAVFDARRGVLTLPSLFPGVEVSSPMVAGLNAIVRSRTERGRPTHKRIDGRRARVSSAIRRGDWSLVVSIRGGNHEYAVQRALNLVNDLFLFLHEAWPEYLIETFGLSPE
jgi:hypothetical protein